MSHRKNTQTTLQILELQLGDYTSYNPFKHVPMSSGNYALTTISQYSCGQYITSIWTHHCLLTQTHSPLPVLERI